MKRYKTDVAVLLLFFCREEQTRQVFNAIKEARPSKLFLYQDGARENHNDESGILACRTIVENIDWDCEVHRMYQTQNFGCDPSEYIAQKWMFSHVDKGIVLEDDDVPSQSFFPFCKELLDKYENDTRINMICGMNHLGEYEDTPYDYFFAQTGSIWGWASWKRVIDEWDSEYVWLNKKHCCDAIKVSMGENLGTAFIQTATTHKQSGKAHYESILGANCILQERLNIIPKRNLISNIGIGQNTTHGSDSLTKYPRATRKLFFMKLNELEFPLNHPKIIFNDKRYIEAVNIAMRGSWFVRVFKLRRIESFLYRIFPFLGRIG